VREGWNKVIVVAPKFVCRMYLAMSVTLMQSPHSNFM
jgi:hypothetical protein